jgi:outer membrane protein OmpA-like peptidoglycan-associated protein
MVRPEGGSITGRVGLRAGVLLLAVAFHSVTPVHATAPAAAGPLDARDRAAASGQRLQRLAGGASEAYGPEQRAQELYLDGMEKLDGGHGAWAQQTFETLIARFPETTAAALARRRLGELYRGGAMKPAAGASEAPRAARRPKAAPALVRSEIWAEELRRNAAIQLKLRDEAGDRVFFSAGSAELGSRAREALWAQAQWLKRWHEFEAAIEGHADEPGTTEENLKLSEQRAEAVRRRLVEEGVDASRLAVVAMGSTDRIATCPEPECSAQNRRAITLVFASGTRERLGLVSPAPLADALVTPGTRSLAPETARGPAAADWPGPSH